MYTVAGGSAYNGSYIYSHHTGAGSGIAAASTNASYAMTANLLPPAANATDDGYQVGFTFTGNQYGPWYMDVVVPDFYSSTSPVTIGGSNPPDTDGYFFGGNGLYWNSTGFFGWAICTASYDVPQLFAITNNATNLACSCVPVYLYSVPAPNPA
ncbi:uncharacterized protein AB675_564 [Cyphellophora attinorum]|uniref:DUF7907 domain-containing protein n=1 Tax=Cyphellophora attinorum TaxID=1664694 RepID=A0A0N1HBC2_9EURO|nr:uncharacterized protein AB675_564 [Phialophora attinorum]KPI45826.1 hypothetical protein AB675_564 [Phialophora attinorum]